jgi:hypothetical protein
MDKIPILRMGPFLLVTIPSRPSTIGWRLTWNQILFKMVNKTNAAGVL